MEKTIVQKSLFKTADMIKISILGVISFIIMFIEVPVFFVPGFLKIDASDLPGLIGAFALGPIAGIFIELIKNLLHLFKTSTGGVGELANFIVGSAFVYSAGVIYHMKKTKKSAIIGCIFGTIFMSFIAGLCNLYILIPVYSKFMPIEAIVGMTSEVNSLVVDLNTFILYGIVPFNILKGILISIATLVLYKYISPVLKKS
ncbi:MAG: ECF transporter S component [Peptostreptococcaceae bacterium]|jgi:riboflavin transporter FmnP|nr:ECF transporter S component [Peptostreptococcaceae bacterium]